MEEKGLPKGIKEKLISKGRNRIKLKEVDKNPNLLEADKDAEYKAVIENLNLWMDGLKKEAQFLWLGSPKLNPRN